MVNIDVLADLNGVDSGGWITKFHLPSMNLRYNLNDDHALRLSLSKTYTLPQAKGYLHINMLEQLHQRG